MRLLRLLPLLLAACGARSAVTSSEGPSTSTPSTPHVYIAESAVHGDDARIIRVDDLSGAGWTTFPVPALYPCDITVDAQQRIYLTTSEPRAVMRMDDMLGTGIVAFSNPGSGTGQLLEPGGLALDVEGRLYVVDSGSNRIVRMNDIDGSGWVSLGGPAPGTGVGAFDGPRGITVSAEGKILVSDTNNERVVQMDDITGAGWKELVIPPGTMPPAYPWGVSYDAEGRIYVADFQSSMLHRFDDIGGGGHAIFLSGDIVQLSHVFVGADDRVYLGMLNAAATVAVMDDITGAGFTKLTVPAGEKPLRNPCGVYVR